MKFGKVLTYKDVEEAKKLIGKKVLRSDFQKIIDTGETEDLEDLVTELVEVEATNMRPFCTKDGHWWQFIREVIEEDEPKRMTNRQLAEWLAKGNGQMKYTGTIHIHYSYYGELEDGDNEEAPKGTFIRPWGSDEWIVPTLEIYERDCKSNKSDDRVAEDMVGKV